MSRGAEWASGQLGSCGWQGTRAWDVEGGGAVTLDVR